VPAPESASRPSTDIRIRIRRNRTPEENCPMAPPPAAGPSASATQDDPEERLPWQQFLLDDIFLLTMAGLVVPTLLYIVWGLMELSNVPVFAP
jgi:hypothetical protein